MRLFSVPADFRTGTIDRLAELNASHQDAAVSETYGCATWGGFSGSGRRSPYLPPVDLRHLEKYVGYAASRGIDFNYTLNASCTGNSELTGRGLRRVERFLARLWAIGIRHLTVSMPTLMTIIKESGYPFSVKASTICQINSAYKAEHYRDRGVERIVIDEDITRDFGRIRQICAAFGDGVEMIVNSVCIKDCPNKMFHYNHEAHFSTAQAITTFHSYNCRAAGAIADPRDIMRLNWVRPEDLGLYERAGIHRFKLQGRPLALAGDVVRATETYMGASYDGNLYDLLYLFAPDIPKTIPYYPHIENSALEGFLRPFFDDPAHCTGECAACGHCALFAAAGMGTDANRELIPAAKDKIANKAEPFAAYRRRHAVKRLYARVARRGRSVGSRVKHLT